MRSGWLIFSILLLVAGCKKKNRIPGDVIPQEKMEVVLFDLMRADQFLADYVLNRDTTKDKKIESSRYYQHIFAIHNIDREEFQRSFSFYRSHPDLLRVIMDSISRSRDEAPTHMIEQPQVLPDTTAQKGGPSIADSLFKRKRDRPAVTE